MTICLGFHQGDAHLAKRLLQWIARLGGCKGHKLILLVDAGCPWQLAREIHQEAGVAFSDSVEVIDNGKSVKGWPQGPNSLFWTAAKRIYKARPMEAWLWLEPDAIPLKPGWADILEHDSIDRPELFKGAVIDAPPGMNGVPSKYMNGVAMYDPHAYDLLKSTQNDAKAFDITAAPIMVEQGVNTPLIQCFWGKANQVPTFIKGNGMPCPADPPYPIPLSFLRPDAALFHRVKDGTLIKLLWEKMFPGTFPGEPFVVVLPFHNGDAPAQIDNLKWMAQMCHDHQMTYPCVLSYEKGTLPQFVMEANSIAERVFYEVKHCTYPTAPVHRWPAGANWAFKNTAVFMAALKRNWLWMESDMIPLSPDWLDKLQTEYAHCGKPVMGPVVKALGHVQGTAVYPFDILTRCPKMGSVPDHSAFDTWSKNCVAMINHDCSTLMAHVWGIDKGMPHPVVGTSPVFRTMQEFVNWVPKGAVTFHRCKDGSLTRFLRQKYQTK